MMHPLRMSHMAACLRTRFDANHPTTAGSAVDEPSKGLKKMNIEQIISRVSDYEARENIHQQFLKEILILGEREALEFARFRADALADANEQAARQAKQSFHRALIIGAIYAAALAFAIGFMIGRAV